MDLAAVRTEIDAVDRQLLPLFLRRMELSAAAAEAKRARGLPVRDPVREEQILEAVAARAGDRADAARRLYETIFALSRELQTGLMDGGRP